MLIVFPKFSGKISGFYGQTYTNSTGVAYSHEGMDIGVVTGTPIPAACDAVVAYTDLDPLYGNYVRLYSKKLNTCFFYAHMSEVFVKTGDHVAQGQMIGKSGATGNTGTPPGPHIHFEIRGMNEDGSYKTFKPGQLLFRQNGRLDPIGWLEGWLAAGNLMEEK